MSIPDQAILYAMLILFTLSVAAIVFVAVMMLAERIAEKRFAANFAREIEMRRARKEKADNDAADKRPHGHH